MYNLRWSLIACIVMSCVALQSGAQEPARATSPVKRLDLRPPKITDVLSPQAIERALRATRDPNTLEEVEVEGGRIKGEPRSPVVPGGILAPFWALLNPAQSWRILAPVPSDQTSDEPPPAATDPYRPPILPKM